MRIGCLGWGSLIWDPRDLPFRGIWFRDGPLVPIEFARQSKDDRITLVLVSGRPVVRSLWSVLSVRSLDEAQTALAKREGTDKENIGVWKTGTADANTSLQVCQTIGQWAMRLALDSPSEKLSGISQTCHTKSAGMPKSTFAWRHARSILIIGGGLRRTCTGSQ